MPELGWGELGAAEGRLWGLQDPPPGPGSAHPPCASPKKAEQDIELWKKQEAAAKEAESSPPGSEEQPEVKVPLVSLGPGGTAPRGLRGGEGQSRSWGLGRGGGGRPLRSPRAVPNRSCPSRKPSGSRWT